MPDSTYAGKLAIQQRVVPNYRKPFFEELADRCDSGLSIFAGLPMKAEQIIPAENLANINLTQTHNQNFLEPSSYFYLCRQKRFIQFLDEQKPDALIVEANPRFISTFGAIQWMHKKSLPVIGWGLGIGSRDGLTGIIRNSWQKRFIDYLDGIIAYSSQGAAQYKKFGFPEERIFISHNAVIAAPSVDKPVRISRKNERPVVLFVGRLQQRKNLDFLFSACAGLHGNSRPEIWIVGDGPFRIEYENIASTVFPETRFFGSVYGEELAGFFKQADIFVMPGTGGLAIQQAMAYGLPVIVGKGDGTQSDLVRPENGWILPDEDPKSISKALELAFSDPDKLKEMGEESFRIVREAINIQSMADVFVSCLNQISISRKH